ncbi:MAG: hypothetical protein K6A43_07000, partial [Treponema sp.]|nr:hypothetical protein [Treponema sp.]
LPYGQTEITAKVWQKQENTYAEYKITFNKVKFSVSEESSTSTNVTVEDETSKLDDLNVEIKKKQKIEFEKNKTIYTIIVDEETDEIEIDPTIKKNENITNPVSKTKNAVLQANTNTVPLLGGLQVISFDVEEEGFAPRTYTIYVYKEIGNTKLFAINYKSFAENGGAGAGTNVGAGTNANGNWTEQKISAASYSTGVSEMSPSSVKNCNGGTVSNPVTYKLYARADAEVDVTKMKFTISQDDKNTTLSYFVGSNCPAENDDAWKTELSEFDLNNESSADENASADDKDYAKTCLWVKATSRKYYHEKPIDSESETANGNSARTGNNNVQNLTSYGSDLNYSDVTYHKIEIYKPSSANSKINYLKAVKIAEVIDAGQTSAEEKVYTYENTKNVRYSVDSNIASKEIGTDYDIVKIRFRLADKSEQTENGYTKKVTYSAVNVRSSDTCGEPNTQFTGYSPDSEQERIELTPDENGYYTIILGESDVEQITNEGIVYSTKDFPMGTTNVKIYVNGELSETLVYTKPDLDTYEIDNSPSSLVGGNGTYQYKNGIFYINNSVESISLNVKMHQKNQSLYVTKYEQTSGINGAAENQDLGIENVTNTQDGATKVWNSNITNIPVGTSVVTYGVSSALAQNGSNDALKNDHAFTVTIVRAADSESRLRTFTLNQFAVDSDGNYAEKASEIFKQGSGFNWNGAGDFARTETVTGTDDNETKIVSVYYNIYENTIPTAKYNAFLQTVSADSNIQAELYATNAVNLGKQTIQKALTAGTESELFVNAEDNTNSENLANNRWLLLESAISNTTENYQSAELGTGNANETTGTGEWIITGAEYKSYLVHAKVTSSDSEFIHHYYLILSVELDNELDLSATVNQFANKDSVSAEKAGELTEGDIESSETPQIEDGIEFTYTTSEFVTNLNRTGKVVITPQKNFSSSWYTNSQNGKIVTVTLYNSQTKEETELGQSYYSENQENHEIELSSDIYTDGKIPGNEIHVKYGIQSQDGKKVLYHTYKILISTLKTVTEYKKWTRTDSYSYVLPEVANKNQLAFRFGSKITDENHPAKNIEHGGIDVIATKDGGTTWGATSYNFSGLHYVVQIEDEMYLAKLSIQNSYSENSTTATATEYHKISLENGVYKIESEAADATALDCELTVNAFVKYDGETPYLSISANVKSAANTASKLGVIMDTLVADDSKATDHNADSVEIKETNNGFEMEGDGYKFNVLLKNALEVDDVDGFWYGNYINTATTNYSYFENVFDSSAACSSSTSDSALSFFWNLDSGENTKTIRLSVE